MEHKHNIRDSYDTLTMSNGHVCGASGAFKVAVFHEKEQLLRDGYVHKHSYCSLQVHHLLDLYLVIDAQERHICKIDFRRYMSAGKMAMVDYHCLLCQNNGQTRSSINFCQNHFWKKIVVDLLIEKSLLSVFFTSTLIFN